MLRNIERNYPQISNKGLIVGFFLGIDLGTSGIRSSIINDEGKEVSKHSILMSDPLNKGLRKIQDPNIWWHLVKKLIRSQCQKLGSININPEHILAISTNGTSGTILLTDENLTPLTKGEMYSSKGFEKETITINKFCPKNHITSQSNSSLAKLLYLKNNVNLIHKKVKVLHQADWISAKLRGGGFFSDDNNSLKLGFDLSTNQWPEWITQSLVNQNILPQVFRPGKKTGTISSKLAKEFGLTKKCMIISGTTDSISSFLAHDVKIKGEAVTSLGTTLSIKILSDKPIQNLMYGIYSHRILDKWLVGGASNTGGIVLKKFFKDNELKFLEKKIDPEKESNLSYYPLVEAGERFPINDPYLKPKLTPRPSDDSIFLHGILESIANIEKNCFSILENLGSTPLKNVFTSGGGANSKVWRSIRQRILGVPVQNNPNKSASLGSAKLALMGYQTS